MTSIEGNKKGNVAIMIFVPTLSKLEGKTLKTCGEVDIEKFEFIDTRWLVVASLNRAGKKNLSLYLNQ